MLVKQYGAWALIAGASEGTGADFARQIAAAGVNLILIARQRVPQRDLANQLVQAHGIDCLTIPVDLTCPDAPSKILAEIGTREVGLLIANAGADLNGSEFLDAELAAWEKLIALNVTTPLALCHHLGRKMRERGRGGIILLGTGVSYGGMKSLAVYSGTKSFLLNFGESLWSELRPHGVHVLNFMLARTDTPASRRALAEKGLPLPTALVDAADVARTALERLPFGPVHNWGSLGSEPGFAPKSPDARRERIARLEEIGRAGMK